MKKPNFFIIGAPKCGTTSLYKWLSDHPNIYMSPVKEPHFFCKDFNRTDIPSLKEYERLFRSATNRHIAVGEASPTYLFSKVAVPIIEDIYPGARYIVMVRNPVEMAYSLHEQAVFSGTEHIHDFATAWKLSSERRQGYEVTCWCREPKLLDYQMRCRLGEQIERLFSIVPRHRALVLVLDDIKENPGREYIKVLDFLGVPDDGRTDFPVMNPAKERRWLWLRKVLLAIGRASTVIKRILGLAGRGTGLLKTVDNFNISYRPRAPMPPECRAKLTAYFRTDILLLERLLDRDLRGWLKPEGFTEQEPKIGK